MGAPVRIEDEAFSDSRYVELAAYAGLADADHARSKMEHLWRQCTIENTYWLPGSVVRHYLGPNGVDAIVRARLGEIEDSDLVRIRGTKGRTEWLNDARNNGRKGGRPVGKRKKPYGYRDPKPYGSENHNPLSLAPDLSLAMATDPEKTPVVPKGDSDPLVEFKRSVDAKTSERRRRKAKPSEPSEDEAAIALRVLARLGERNGVSYSGSEAHVRLIVARLRDGVSEMELRAVAGYCASSKASGGMGWLEHDAMRNYLRPETLFGPQTIQRYLDSARTWARDELAKHQSGKEAS